MLCYVFQTEGKLLCCFPIEAETLPAAEEDHQARQADLLGRMSPNEQKRFLTFCKGSGKNRRSRGGIDTASLAMCLQQQGTALYAERYDRSQFPLQNTSGILLHLLDRSILCALNARYAGDGALILTLFQHTASYARMRPDALLLGNMPQVVRYLLTMAERVYEPGQEVSSHALYAYRQDQSHYSMEESLDLWGIVSFLTNELPKLPMFDGIRLCCDQDIEQLQNIWIVGKRSSFVYIYVLLTYFASIVSTQCRSHTTIAYSGDGVCLRVYSHIPHQTPVIETTGDISPDISPDKTPDMMPLIRLFPACRGFLLMLHWLLTRNAVPYTYQITETDTGRKRLDMCLHFQTIPKEEIVFRHLTEPSEMAVYLSEVEFLLFMLLSGGDIPEM